MPIKISQLPTLITSQINSTDLIPIVNSSTTKKVTLDDLSKKILGGLQFTSSLSGNTNINIGSTNAMTINTSGSIGIGTNNPSYKLHVVTDGVDHNIQCTRYNYSNEGGTIRLTHARGSLSAPTSVIVDDVLGAVVGEGYGSTAWTGTASSRIDFTAEENFTDSAHGSSIRFITTQNGTMSSTRQERMRITNSGNVGIGTNTPRTKLEVNGHILTGRGDNNLEGGQLSLARSYDNEPEWYIDVYGNTDRPALRIFNKISEMAIILPSGNVGIGTNTPGYKLHVNGTIAGTSAYTNLSDKREKENIDYSFQHGLSDILLLKPVKFDYINGEKDHLGFIAQDVIEIIPEIIGSFQKDVNGEKQERLTIKESSIIPILVKAIQELAERLEKLESKKSKSKK